MDNPTIIGGNNSGGWTGWFIGGANSFLETAKNALGYDDTKPVPTDPTVGLNTGVSQQTDLQTRGASAMEMEDMGAVVWLFDGFDKSTSPMEGTNTRILEEAAPMEGTDARILEAAAPVKDTNARILEEASKAADDVLKNLINPAIHAIETGNMVVSYEIAKLAQQCKADPVLLLMLKTGQALLVKGEYQAAQRLEYLYQDEGRILKKCFKTPFKNIQDFETEVLTREGKTLFRSPTAIPSHIEIPDTIKKKVDEDKSLENLQATLTALSDAVAKLKSRQQESTEAVDATKRMTQDYVVCDEFAAAAQELIGFMLKLNVSNIHGGKWLSHVYERSQFLNECLDQGWGEKIRIYLSAKDKLNTFLKNVKVRNYSVEEPVPAAPAAPVANIGLLREAQEENLDPIRSLRQMVDIAISESLKKLSNEPEYKKLQLSEEALKEKCRKDIGSFRSMMKLPQLLSVPLTVQSIQQIEVELKMCGEVIKKRVTDAAQYDSDIDIDVSKYDGHVTTLTHPVKAAEKVAEHEADKHRKKVFARFLWVREQVESSPGRALLDNLPYCLTDLMIYRIEEKDTPATLEKLYSDHFKGVSDGLVRKIEEWANNYPTGLAPSIGNTEIRQ